MEDINVTTSGIIKLLQNLDVHKVSGPDEISTRLLKETAEVTAHVLKLIFEKSLDTGEVPYDYYYYIITVQTSEKSDTQITNKHQTNSLFNINNCC